MKPRNLLITLIIATLWLLMGMDIVHVCLTGKALF